MIRNIIFDLGNVIVRFDKLEIISPFTDKEDEIDYILKEIFKAREWAMLDLGNITNKEAAEVINKRNNYKYAELTEKFLDSWYKNRFINRDVVVLAKKLKAKGYNLYVLSNMANLTYNYIKSDEFFSLCTGIVISAQEHVKKPDEKVYEILLERNGLKAEECVFIDDDDSGRNYETANRIGIKGRRVIPNDVNDMEKMLKEFGVEV